MSPVRWWQCLFGHHWTQWTRAADGITQRMTMGGVQIGEALHLEAQERVCVRCGIKKMRVKS